MRYKHCTFGCDRLIIKGSLLEEQRVVWTVSRFLMEKNSLVRYTLCFTLMRYKYCKFGCDRSITKGTLLEDKGTFSSVSRLKRKFPGR